MWTDAGVWLFAVCWRLEEPETKSSALSERSISGATTIWTQGFQNRISNLMTLSPLRIGVTDITVCKQIVFYIIHTSLTGSVGINFLYLGDSSNLGFLHLCSGENHILFQTHWEAWYY